MITDCLKYDKGILDDSETRDIYEVRDANSSFTRTSEGSILKEVNVGTDALLKLTIPSLPIAVEFDYKRVDGATSESFLNVYSDNTYKTYFAVSRVNIPIGDWVKLRLTISEGSATLTNLDDPTQTGTNSFTGSANNVRWYTSSTCTECHFKNVKVYPI